MGSCCCSDAQGVYDKVSYYDEEEEEEMHDIVSPAHVIVDGLSVDTTVVTMTARGGIEEDEQEDDVATEEGDSDSVEDPLYYTQYRVLPSPITLAPHAKRNEDIVRENYERALFTFCSSGGTTGASPLMSQIRKNLIYEYEEYKSNYFSIEYCVTAESLLREARETLAPERKNALYREALLHTTDLERKRAIKDEYNEVYRATSQ